MLKPSRPFPEFSLPDQNGLTHSRDELLGKWSVIYCYPKDNTSGCSSEAMDFADRFLEFNALGALVFGVSADTRDSHARFAGKLGLPFPLLSDPAHSLLAACDVWQEKKTAGHTYMGIVRTTFLIDPKGFVRVIWPKVKVQGHAAEVLARLIKEKSKDAI